jgi:hypothetical protein
MILELAVLKNFDAGTYKAAVQLAGSLTTYFDDVPVSRAIPTSALVTGNRVILAIPGDNPKDACVIAAWPQGSPGGAEVHGNEYHDPDFEQQGVAASLIETHRTTATHTQPQPANTLQDSDADTKIQVEKSPDEDKIRMAVKGIESFLLNDTGVLTLAKQSAARAYLPSADQVIPNVTWTTIQLSAKNYDIQNEFDTTNYRFIAKTAGLYLVYGACRYRAPVADCYVYAGIAVNGTRVATAGFHTSFSGYVTPMVTDIIQLNVGSHVELQTYHNCGVDENVCYQSDRTWMSIIKLA